MSLFLAALFGLLVPAALQDGPDERYAFIDGLQRKELHDLTVKESEKFLRDYPSDRHADLVRYRMASALFELDEKDRAAEEFRALTAVPDFPFSGEAWFRLGQCEMAGERYPAASEALTRALDVAQDYLKEPATFLLAESLFRQDRFAEAQARYTAVLELAPEGQFTRDASYGNAWCAFRLEDYDAAIARIQAFLDAWPQDEALPEMYFLLGESQLEAGRPKEALAAYHKVEGGPFRDAALRGAGFARAALDDHAGAAEEFAVLLRDYPASRFAEEVALHSGIQLLRAGKDGEAVKPLDLAIALAQEDKAPPRMAEALYWRAQAEGRLGDKEKALQSLDLALKNQPSDELTERINIARGDALFELGRASEATAAYGHSGSAYAVHAAAVASLNAGRNEEAARLARTVLEQYGDSPYVSQAQLTLGESLLRQEDYEPALAAFREAAKDDTDAGRHSRALSRLAWCLYLMGRPAEAAAGFALVVQTHPDGTEAEEARFMTGRAFEAAGDAEQASAAWNDYLTTQPEGTHRAEVLMGLARLEPGEKGAEHLAALIGKHADSDLVPQALYDLAERLSGAGRFKEAAPRYQALIDGFPGHELVLASWYGIGWCFYQDGRFEEAARALQPVVAREEDDNEPRPATELELAALELLIWTYHEAGNAAAAGEAFLRFNQACPDEERRFRAAQAALAAFREQDLLDDAQQALDAFTARVERDDLAASMLVEQAYLGLDRNDLPQAETLARQALQKAPESTEVAEAFFFVGEAAFEAGDFEKAAGLYQVAASVRDCPVRDKALYKQGFAFLRLEDLPGAERAFRTLTDDHADSVLYGECLFLLGEARFRQDELAEAAEVFQRLRSDVPRHEIMPKALFRLGITLCRLERWQEAEEALSELTLRAPDFPNAVEADLWRGRALAALDNARAARQAFDRVVANDRGILAAQARIGIGKLQMKAGSLEDALAEFLKVAVLYAHEDEVSEGLYLAGQCLERLDDPDRARSQYREILDKYPESAFAGLAQDRLNEMSGARVSGGQARIRER